MSPIIRRRRITAAIVHARDGTERELWRRGRQVGTIREYDNRLLQFLLRTLQPEVYGQSGGRRGR